MIVRLCQPLEDGLYAAGEVLRLRGSVGAQLIFEAKAEAAVELEAQAVPFDPEARRREARLASDRAKSPDPAPVAKEGRRRWRG